MGSRTVISAIALGRLGLGSALLFAPSKVVGSAWVGDKEASRPTTSLLLRAVGARDVALALGTLIALRQGGPLKPWLIGGALADGTDFAATTAAGAALPVQARAGVGTVAGGALVAQLALLREVE